MMKQHRNDLAASGQVVNSFENPDNDGNICFVLQNNTDKKQIIEF